MVHGRPWLQSVDSERAGRVIEPRKQIVVDADAVASAEGTTAAGKSRAARPERSNGTRRVHRGRRAGHVRKGPPGTWEVWLPPRER